MYCACCFADTAHNKPVQQRRIEGIRAYCSNIHTVATSTIFSFNHKEVTAANRIRALAKQLTLKSFVSKNFVTLKTHSFNLSTQCFYAFSLLSRLLFVCTLKAHHHSNFAFEQVFWSSKILNYRPIRYISR